MNDFKKFIQHKDSEIHYKILNNERSAIPELEFVMSYPNKDIWGDNDKDDVGIYYKKIYINRNKWMELQGYDHIGFVMNDFDEALKEFNSGLSWTEYTTKINKHFINIVTEIV